MKNKGKELKNIDLKKLSSMHVGGKAKRLFVPKNIEQLNNIIKYSKKISKNCIILGNCSNIIFHDKVYRDVFVSMKGFDTIRANGDIVSCGAGISLFTLCMFCEQHELTGLEPLYGIPGSVGGAIAMNAGAFGDEICNHLDEFVSLQDGEIKTKNKFDFAYRKGPLDSGEILIEAKFKLNKGKKEEIIKKQMQFLQKRKSLQPSLPSCGSVFMRGKDFSPAKLIDEWRLKGLTVGGAMISTKHAGFIVNASDATFEDVILLIQIVEWIAKSKGYEFEREIKII